MASKKINIAADTVVSFHYTVSDSDGIKIDSSVGEEPLTYLHGREQIVPGLERAMTGHDCGDKFSVAVPAKDAYGEANDDMVLSLPKSKFENEKDLKVGNMFELEDQDGNAILVRIKEVTKDEVIVDGNHPLAGKDLKFDVEVISIRAATKEELEHGHVHSGSCCG